LLDPVSMPTKAQLHDLIDRFAGCTALVVGDLTLDEFMTGFTERISREAPVLILRHEHTRQVPGGAANAAYNLARLGGRVAMAGVVGDDLQGAALRNLLGEAGIDVSGLVVDPSRPTVTKTRISAHSRQSVTQQVVRVDRKSDVPLAGPVEAQLAERIRALAPNFAALVCSDYQEGVFTEQIVATSTAHPRAIVDTHLGLERYQGAYLFTPNLPEAEAAAGFAIKNGADLERAGATLLAATGAKYVLITRGEEGMTLFGADGSAHHIPAFNRTQVFDVTGAGDTVVAALTLALVAGGSAHEAAILGNLAASIVVRRFGTATTTPTELHAHLEDLEWKEIS
jgi:rfaE bifunctional protein kinase chain/domain